MAYDFNGTTGYFTAPIPSISDPCSISAWVFADSFTGFPNIVALNVNLIERFTLTLDESGTVLAISVDTTTVQDIASSTADLTVSTWGHAGAVFASNTSRSAYANGGNKGTTTTSITVGALTLATLGALTFSGGSVANYLDGKIAEVGVWNVALTDDEMASLGKRYSPRLIRPASLVFYAPLIRNLQDVRGAATISTFGTTAVATHSPVIQSRRRRPAQFTAPPPPPETLFAQACL
jgi:hypothetical protein